MKNMIYIANTKNNEYDGEFFDHISKAINYLQGKGYSDYEICECRFIPVTI